MWIYLVTFFLALLAYFYKVMTKDYGYFAARGVPESPGIFPLGSKPMTKVIMGKASLIALAEELLDEFGKVPYFGYYAFTSKYLVINDIEVAKQVLIKDFDHFMDRRPLNVGQSTYSNKVFSEMLTVLTGEKWKGMRGLLSPVFTSGKLKGMAPMVNKTADDMVEHLKGVCETGESFEGKAMMMSYTLDSIASCGYGVQTNSFKDPKGQFKVMVDRATGNGERNYVQMAKFMILFTVPKIAEMFKMSIIEDDVTRFFTDVIRQTVNHRKTTGTKRNDFIDLIIEAMESSKDAKGSVEVEDDQFEKDAQVSSKAALDALSKEEFESLLVSNLFGFFFAGFDTTSTFLGILLWCCAKYQEEQDTLRAELMEAIEENNGSDNLDYNTVQGMPYLDMFIHEGMRMYPVTLVERLCTKDYKIPGSDFVVPKGMIVQIAGRALMHGDDHFPNPTKFNPENFNAENKAKRSPYAFLTFGQGPRNCIGMRFALLMLKMCLVKILTNFRVVPCEKTVENLKIDPLSTSFAPLGGTWVKLEKL